MVITEKPRQAHKPAGVSFCPLYAPHVPQSRFNYRADKEDRHAILAI
nr:MAG TPA: hypothetical protein [Caudoviricetes sp.]